MPNRREQRLKVVGVPREGGPDLERIARAIVTLALEQLRQEAQQDESSPPGGAAA